MAYQFIQANKERYAVTETAGLLGVSREVYYQWARTGVSDRRNTADAELVRQELRQVYGKRASLKKAARLMRENGLNAKKRGKFIRTADSDHAFAVCENILGREFHAETGGQKRVSDITCLRTASGRVYLAAVLDLYGRKAIGWAFSGGMEASETAVAALQMAVKNRYPQGALIFYSDRGVQYCAQSFRDALRGNCPAVRQSMSRKGNCRGNACVESFFKTLKRELETLDGKHSGAEARQSVFYYIEAYYNRVRIHSALGYVAPNEYNYGKVADRVHLLG
jgi:transposase InsO family protein